MGNSATSVISSCYAYKTLPAEKNMHTSHIDYNFIYTAHANNYDDL